MRLRSRIWLTLGGIASALVVFLLLLLPPLLRRGFERIEQRAMRTDLDRASAAIAERVTDLSTKCVDWANWDDTHRFVSGLEPDYPASNLSDNALDDIKVDVMMFLDLSGHVVHARHRDRARSMDRPVPSDLLSRARELRLLTTRSDQPHASSGVLLLAAGPMMVSARSILPSTGTGTAAGTLVMGRWLDAEALRKIEARTRLDLQVLRLDHRVLGPERSGAARTLMPLGPDESVIRAVGADRLLGDRLVRDLTGRPALLLEVSSPRAIAREGERSLRLVALAVLLAALLMAVASAWLIERGVLRPVVRLSHEMAGVGSRDDLTARVTVAGATELSALARDVNTMLAAIESSHSRLRESESILRTFYDHGTIQRGVVEVEDGVVRYLDCNANSAAVIGRPVEEIRGRTTAELGLSGELNRVWAAAYEATAASGEPHRFEYEVMVRGERRFMAGIVSVLDRPDGAAPHFGYAVEDVTDHRRVEAELREARDAAEAASRAKSQFLATMSHEIRTPLNGVLGMTTLLLDTDLSAGQREQAQLIQSSAEVLLDVLNDILDLSKIEAERMTLEPLPFDLVDMIEDLAELMQARAQEHAVEIIVHITDGTPRVLVGDTKRLRQVLLNLVGNAIKFTQSGCVVIEAEGRPNGAGTMHLRMSVMDTGIGIPAANQAALFQPFRQGDASTSRRFGGTGLGLAISKRLVELMGGAIGFTSEEGLGSVFWFELELPVGEQRSSDWPQPRPGLRALVLDDLGPARGAIVDTLASAGVHAVAVASGADACAALNETGAPPFDVLIADAPHIDIDCESFERACRIAPAIATLPRIMLALGGGGDEAATATSHGCAAYLTKPLRARLLLAAVEAVTRPVAQRPRQLVTRTSLLEARHATHVAPALASFAGARVLVAEDNLTNQKVAARMLERFGCEVEVAADGLEALRLASREGFDLVLMDMQMPTMDGLEATRAIRALSTGASRVPIVALTANSMPHERQAAFDAGMDGFLGKPLRREELEATLREHLRGDRRAAARAA